MSEIAPKIWYNLGQISGGLARIEKLTEGTGEPFETKQLQRDLNEIFTLAQELGCLSAEIFNELNPNSNQEETG